MKLCKVLIAVASTMIVLGTLAGFGSARQLSFSETRLTATFARASFSGGFGTVRCNLTLASSLHSRTIPKILESLIGYITEASVGACEAGSATILRETLPWHQRYTGFEGTLPNFRGFGTKIIGAGFRIQEPEFTFECLVTTTTSNPITQTRNFIAGALTSIGLGGSIACWFSTGTLGGSSNSISPATNARLI